MCVTSGKYMRKIELQKSLEVGTLSRNSCGI